MSTRIKAFTLIELLIVVAIIAILAAIAVPNFLEAQVRSKVSRVKNDMRSMAVALENYCIDHNMYPADGGAYSTAWGREPFSKVQAPDPILKVLTTPIGYMTSLPREPFSKKYHSFWNRTSEAPHYSYVSKTAWIENVTLFGGPKAYADWDLASIGPDMLPGGNGNLAFGLVYAITRSPMSAEDMQKFSATHPNVYDATNGTVSYGDIERVGP